MDTSPDYLVRLGRTGKVIIADYRRTATAALDINRADLVICYRPSTRMRSPPGKGTGSPPFVARPGQEWTVDESGEAGEAGEGFQIIAARCGLIDYATTQNCVLDVVY
jgi:hypothetical protein